MTFYLLMAISCSLIILIFITTYFLKISLVRKIAVFLSASIFTIFLLLSITLSFELLSNLNVVVLSLIDASIVSICISFYVILPLIINKFNKGEIYKISSINDVRTPSFYQKPLKNDVVEVIRAKNTGDAKIVVATPPNIGFSKKIIDGLNKINLSKVDRLTLSKIKEYFDDINLTKISKEALSKNNYELCKLSVKYNYDPVTDSIINK